ncbi:hypothetical protein Tco_1422412 [Tanacetum coccineum]
MMCSFGSLKESTVNISYATTNKAFQVLEDPSGLESPFNGMYKFLAPCHIPISPKLRVHARVEPIDLVFLNSVIQYFHNICQRTITEFVNLIEPHDLLFIVTDREHNCTRRLNDCIVVLLFTASRIWDVGMTQEGSGVAGLSSSGIGFNHSGLYLIFGRWAESVSSKSDILAESNIGMSSTGCLT